MIMLAIETSCDETAISIVNFKSKKKFTILSDSILSQIKIHEKYGGVYPLMAKREHIKNIFPLLLASLKKAKILKKKKGTKINKEKWQKIKKILNQDEYNLKNIINLFENYQKPRINAISVTYGPGLEMALWTGFNIARALSEIWNIELIPTNHMEGHIFSSLILKKKDYFLIQKPTFPALALLISGGHTDLVLIENEKKYKIIGTTLDDAVGEAYDKSARLLGINYPGGPEISKLAKKFEIKNKNKTTQKSISLPRPMLHTNNLNFSFSGLKTAVLYSIKFEMKKSSLKNKKLSENFKENLSAEFEDAVAEILTKKTKKAIEKYKIKSLIVGGGVSANNRLRKEFKKFEKTFSVFLPQKKYTGDNALMIAVAGYYNFKNKTYKKNIKKVNGNLKIDKKY